MKRFQKFLMAGAFLLAISGALASKASRPLFNTVYGIDTKSNCVSGTVAQDCEASFLTRCQVTIPVQPGSPTNESVNAFESDCMTAVYHN